MKYYSIKNMLLAVRLPLLLSKLALVILFFTLSSCDKELDIKTNFPFELQIMPVAKSIFKGEIVTIRCNIKAEGNYQGTKYSIRYFQYEGAGKLLLATPNINGKMVTLKPNDAYELPEQMFRLYYRSEENVPHDFDVWVADNHGHEQKVSFQFNSKTKE